LVWFGWVPIGPIRQLSAMTSELRAQRLKWPWGAEIRKQDKNQKERLIGHVSSPGVAGQKKEKGKRVREMGGNGSFNVN